MTYESQRDLLQVVDRIFKLIDAVKAIQIKIDEVQVTLRGVTIGGQPTEDLNVKATS